MDENHMFDEALNAIDQGQFDRAKDLLARLIKHNKSNPLYWIWMSTVVDTRKEKVYCLRNALHVDPGNEVAQRGLVLLGENVNIESVASKFQNRDWLSALSAVVAPTQGRFAIILANPYYRMASLIAGLIVIIGMMVGGVIGLSKSGFFKPRLTITPIPWTATHTPTETQTPIFRTATPTPEALQPLWMLLEATYTPMPLYVNTPHPLIEAYRAGLSAYAREDYEAMLSFMQQAVREEPDDPDVFYYLGEAYRLNGDYESALDAFDKALELNEEFAPAYVGLAKVRMLKTPTYDVIPLLESAIEFDPEYAEAFLLLAQVYLSRGDVKSSINILDEQSELLDTYPKFYQYYAEALIANGESERALELAKTGYDMDITDLDGYLVYAKALLENGLSKDSVPILDTYLKYRKDDPLGWAYMGYAHLLLNNTELASEYIEQALRLDRDNSTALLIRGLLNIRIGNGQDAVNDTYLAMRAAPNSFDTNYAFMSALFAAERYEDALSQLDAVERLVRNDRDLANVYYWRARILDQLGRVEQAEEAWQALFDLPNDLVPSEWLEEAERRLATSTPTPTTTLTPTSTSTSTNTPTYTSTVTPTITATSSPPELDTPTATLSPTATPSRTIEPIITTTPSPTSESSPQSGP